MLIGHVLIVSPRSLHQVLIVLIVGPYLLNNSAVHMHTSSSSSFLSRPDLSDTKVCEPYIRARLGTAAHFCQVVVLKLRAIVPPPIKAFPSIKRFATYATIATMIHLCVYFL